MINSSTDVCGTSSGYVHITARVDRITNGLEVVLDSGVLSYTEIIRFRKTWASLPDCMDFDDSIPYYNQDYTKCDGSSATCYVVSGP